MQFLWKGVSIRFSKGRQVIKSLNLLAKEILLPKSFINRILSLRFPVILRD